MGGDSGGFGGDKLVGGVRELSLGWVGIEDFQSCAGVVRSRVAFGN